MADRVLKIRAQLDGKREFAADVRAMVQDANRQAATASATGPAGAAGGKGGGPGGGIAGILRQAMSGQGAYYTRVEALEGLGLGGIPARLGARALGAAAGSSMGGMVVAFGAAAAAAALYTRALVHTIRETGRLRDESVQLGISVQEAMGIEYGAHRSGGDAATAFNGIARIRKIQGEANGGDQNAKQLLARAGLNAKDSAASQFSVLAKNFRSGSVNYMDAVDLVGQQALPMLANGFDKAKERGDLLNAIFGLSNTAAIRGYAGALAALAVVVYDVAKAFAASKLLSHAEAFLKFQFVTAAALALVAKSSKNPTLQALGGLTLDVMKEGYENATRPAPDADAAAQERAHMEMLGKAATLQSQADELERSRATRILPVYMQIQQLLEQRLALMQQLNEASEEGDALEYQYKRLEIQKNADKLQELQSRPLHRIDAGENARMGLYRGFGVGEVLQQIPRQQLQALLRIQGNTEGLARQMGRATAEAMND